MRVSIIVAAYLGACIAAPFGVKAAVDPLPQLRTATGCDAWRSLGTLEIRGRHSGDGLDGTFVQMLDLRDGRWVTRSRNGPFESADGYDGATPWSQDFSGASHEMNAPSARAVALTQAWMNARRWCDAGAFVRDRAARIASSDGRKFESVELTPRGGAPVTLFVDRTTHLIDHTVMQLNENHQVVYFSDWRTISGAAFPFSSRSVDPEHRDSQTENVLELRPRARRFASVRFALPRAPADISMAAGAREVNVPYVLDGSKPIVNVMLNGKGPFPFVVDTGGHFILTADTARRVGLTGYGASSSVNEGNVTKVGFTHVRLLQIGGVAIHNQVAEINPYGFAKLERGPRPPKAGWLGLEFFERFAVTFNPATRVMTLRPLARQRPVPQGARTALVFDEDAPLARCTIGPYPGLCMLDTGNAGPTIVVRRWVERNGLADVLVRGVFIGDGARISRIAIGIGSIVRRAELVGYAASKGSWSDPSTVEAAILGERLIDGFVSTFDYARGAVWLQPIPTYAPGVFNRSGVVAAKKPDGTFAVRHIIIPSPAAKADIHRGDIIFAVNGRESSHYSGADFSGVNAGPLGTAVTYRIARGSRRRQVTVWLRDILPLAFRGQR